MARDLRYRKVSSRIMADRLRDKLLLVMHFKAIVKFSKMKERKDENMRTVAAYL